MRTLFAPLLFVAIICSCSPHLKPVAAYVTPSQYFGLFLYKDGKYLLTYKYGYWHPVHAIGTYSKTDSVVTLSNYFKNSEFVVQLAQNKNGKVSGTDFCTTFDFNWPIVPWSRCDLNITILINDSIRKNFKTNSYFGDTYGVNDSTGIRVRSIQLFENNSCYSSERIEVKDSTVNQFIFHIQYLPHVEEFYCYSWGDRNATFSKAKDTLAIDLTLCNDSITRAVTLVKSKNLRKYSGWPFRNLPENERAFLKQKQTSDE